MGLSATSSRPQSEGNDSAGINQQPKPSFPLTALWSGTCGAIASSMAKLAFFSGSLSSFWFGDFIMHSSDTSRGDVSRNSIPVWWKISFPLYEILLRLIFLLIMALCNVVAVSTFVQGMEESGSVRGTALATAANCVVSAMLGILVWNDGLQSFWGLAFVIVGIMILIFPTRATSSKAPHIVDIKSKLHKVE